MIWRVTELNKNKLEPNLTFEDKKQIAEIMKQDVQLAPKIENHPKIKKFLDTITNK